MRAVLIIAALAAVITLTTAATSEQAAPSSAVVHEALPTPSRAQTHCRSARMAVPWYRFWTHLRQTARHSSGLATETPTVRGRSCHWARYAAHEWQARAIAARDSYDRWVKEHTLVDHEWWVKDVDQVQVLFPGSKPWQMSCSSTEGGWGRWVVHGGGDYYLGAEEAKGGREVGGNMQYTFGTFAGHFRAGLAYLREHGYRVPSHLREATVTAWRSTLGQAIASGAAYTLGLRGSHWVGSGC